MTLNIAIVYTGETRTIEKTMQYFKKNVLEANPSIHVFAVLQNREEIDGWIRENIGEHLKSLEWFEKTDATWKAIQKRLLNKMNITPRWKDYLENSGSMIEYYQLYLAYTNMVQYEYDTNTKYDFVLRVRPDIVINKPLDFSVFAQKSSYYVNLMDTIRVYLREHIDDTQITQKQLYILMNNLLDHGRHKHSLHMHSNTIMEKHYNENKTVDDLIKNFTYDALKNYIHQGNYVISLRKNVVYLAGRENFANIATLGMTYGLQKMEENQIWFDAESQFEVACIRGGYAVFNTTTDLEDKSLYEYNRDNYFKEDGDLKSDSSFLFFICRQ
jgi:hypothetical protein